MRVLVVVAAAAVVLAVAVVAAAVASATPNFDKFLMENKLAPPATLPLSYLLYPQDYFDKVPDDDKDHSAPPWKIVLQCDKRNVTKEKLDAFTFQTERLMVAGGSNIYDVSVWAIATTLRAPSGATEAVDHWFDENLLKHKTLQFANIRASAPCRGVIRDGQCADPEESGACGLCYGDHATNEERSLDDEHAYFFRFISDVFTFDGALDARCPDLGRSWTWNDWRPVLGENAWANLIAPLQVAWLRAGGDATRIDDDGTPLTLATHFLTAVRAMTIDSATGGVYYAPRNTFDVADDDIGSTVSTENNISLLGGLRMLRAVIAAKPDSKHRALLPRIEAMEQNVTKYLRASYDADAGYFRQGGRFAPASGRFEWFDELFATDCQTWATSVLGPATIDEWFGERAAHRLWLTTKRIAGYNVDRFTGWASGVGFSDNADEQVFSGEWTFGAIEMVLKLAEHYEADDAALAKDLRFEAQNMRDAINTALTRTAKLPNGEDVQAVLYSNKRYRIPFGWWANPLPSMASTAWATLHDMHCDPLVLGGGEHCGSGGGGGGAVAAA